MRALALLAASALALPAQAPKDPPRIQVDPPGLVDLGSLGPLERKEQAYSLRNASGAPIALRILDLPPGVEVRGPALDGPIPPRGRAPLTLTLDAGGFQGPQRRTVRLGTDDPRQGDYFLPVAAAIRPDVSVDALRADFGEVLVHESPRRSFTFRKETGGPLALRVPAALPPYLEAEAIPVAGGSRLDFTFRPGAVPPGTLRGVEEVRVDTSAPLQPVFDLCLAWRVGHPVEAEPARVVFQDPAGFTRELRLASRDGRPFRILRARVEGPGFRVGSIPGEGASVGVLEVVRTAREPARAMLVLAFAGVEGELRVPLSYQPTRAAP